MASHRNEKFPSLCQGDISLIVFIGKPLFKVLLTSQTESSVIRTLRKVQAHSENLFIQSLRKGRSGPQGESLQRVVCTYPGQSIVLSLCPGIQAASDCCRQGEENSAGLGTVCDIRCQCRKSKHLGNKLVSEHYRGVWPWLTETRSRNGTIICVLFC